MVLNFKIKCLLCGNRKDTDFYIMPLDEKVKSGDYIRSNTKFRIQCKKCGTSFIFNIDLKNLKLNKKFNKE